jgi:hypothetical protein
MQTFNPILIQPQLAHDDDRERAARTLALGRRRSRYPRVARLPHLVGPLLLDGGR